QVMAVLGESLRAHGQLPLPTGDQMLIGVADWRARCAGTQHLPRPAAHILTAEMAGESAGWGLRRGGTGTGGRAAGGGAILEAVIAWQHGQFEALRQAFGAPQAAPDTHLVVRAATDGTTAIWAAHAGPLRLVGEDESLQARIAAQPLVARLGAALADQL